MQEISPLQWAVRPLKQYATFSGRASRAEYWWFYLATVVGSIVLTFVDKLAGDTEVFGGIYNLALLLPTIAVAVRRLHDTNRTGKWLLAIIPPILLAVAGSMGGAATNSSGATSASLIIGGLGVIVAGITLFVFMVLPGNEGSNDYGADPYAPDELEEVFA